MSEDDYLLAEALARKEIDRQLPACGWLVQDRADMNLNAGPSGGFIVRPGRGDAVGAIEENSSTTPAPLRPVRACCRIVEELGAALAWCSELAASLPVEEHVTARANSADRMTAPIRAHPALESPKQPKGKGRRSARWEGVCV